MQAKAQQERDDLAKLTQVFEFARGLQGVQLPSGHELGVAVVENCWELGIVHDGLRWVRFSVDHWRLGVNTIPRALPLLAARWGGHDWEAVDFEEKTGYDTFEQLSQVILDKLSLLDEAAVVAAINRTRGARR